MIASNPERRQQTLARHALVDIEGFFADIVLEDCRSAESIEPTLGDGMVDPNPHRQDPLYTVAQENARVDVSHS
jgi:hypothetical protein